MRPIEAQTVRFFDLEHCRPHCASPISAQQSLGITVHDPWAHAKRRSVTVFRFESPGIGTATFQQLTMVDPDSWSAMTLQAGSVHAVVLNPAHVKTRQRNELMHEISHVDLEHAPSRVEVSDTGLLLLSHYSDEQEQEADWLAAAMLLPRDGIIPMRSRGADAVQIGQHYGVSSQLVEWRLRSTGIDVQLRRFRGGN